MSTRPIFSILHPSARPHAWRAVYDEWIGKCVDLSQVEYLLGVDARWGFQVNAGFDPSKGDPLVDFVNERKGLNSFHWNTERRCYVDAVNNLAKHATGQILIVIADDQFPCEEWDEQLQEYISEWALAAMRLRPFVVRVSTGTPTEHERRIMVMPILSRARYEKLGYVFYPEYESMFADNDFCQHAERDGVVIEAQYLLFPHRHASFDGRGGWKQNAEADEAYLAQGSPEAFRIGAGVLQRRRANGFTSLTASESREAGPPAAAKRYDGKTLAICFPGENFSSMWVEGFIGLMGWCINQGFAMQFFPCYTRSVFTSRMQLTAAVLNEASRADYVLWIDDDNVPSAEGLARLLLDMEERPDIDVAAGWCWIHIPDKHQFFPSCGMWSADGVHLSWLDGRTWPRETALRDIEWTGFPFVLMRTKALVTAGGIKAFLPIIDEKLKLGMGGEDASWCKRAAAAGVKIVADPRVKVAHLKTLSAEPYGSDEAPAVEVPVQSPEIPQESRFGAQGESVRTPRIAAMLRVKNEARWITQVLNSLIPTCDGIVVMDDGSTDDTARLAFESGATVFKSPFIGQPLNEARDKNWLMRKTVELFHPDWILCVDGDEELEPGAYPVIRDACAIATTDCFNIRILYLWNDPEMYRTDGIYSRMKRQSLFRVKSGAEFRSLYEGHGVHCGLHVSNAPRDLATEDLDVCLLHYGYLFQQDRIKKFEYYNRIDPNNMIEDCYRHMVIGDLETLPATAQTRYAGPLELRPIYEAIRSKKRADIVPITPPAVSRLQLNLGCSDRRMPGFVNVDICEPADLIVDLRGEWPWPDSSVDYIRAFDIIEHLPDKNHTMNEIFRVLKPNARVEIVVPTTDGRGAFQDPTHVSFWNRNSFFYYEAGNPHLHRFEKAYGMRCAFRIVSDEQETIADGVVKLHIVLQAVKREAKADAAD